MAINIHTDKKFEQQLAWLAKRSGKTKTGLVKALVQEQYQKFRNGVPRGAFKHLLPDCDQQAMLRELKAMDRDHDLD